MMISIHAPHGGSDPEAVGRNVLRQPISIHAPRGGSDVHVISVNAMPKQFQSTLPVGGATRERFRYVPPHDRFQSTLPVGGATFEGLDKTGKGTLISIHAPRGGSDSASRYPRTGGSYFNPRSPWGERLQTKIKQDSVVIFQSTLPVGGATYCQGINRSFTRISIHAPRGGSDLIWANSWRPPVSFQSTLPVGGATGR